MPALPDYRFNIVANDDTAAQFDAVRTNGQQAFRQLDAGAQASGVAMRRNNAYVANLGFQLNDIGQGLLLGTSPFQLMAQQGFQVAQVLGQAGARSVGGALGLLKTSFTTLVNPVTLATLAIIGGGTAIVRWLTSAKSGTEELEDVTERHTDTVRRLRDVYGEAAAAQEAFGDLEQLQLLVKAQADLGLAMEELDHAQDRARVGVLRLSEGELALFESLRQGAAGAEEFTQRALELAASAEKPGLAAMARRLAELATPLFEAQQFVAELEAEIRVLNGTATEADLVLLGLAGAADEFAKALERMGEIALPQLTDREQIEEDFRIALDAAVALGDVSRAAEAARARSAALRRVAAKEAAEAEEEAAREATRAAEATQREQRAVEDLIVSLEYELSLIGLSAEEQAVMNNLRRAGAIATEEQRERIIALTLAIEEQTAKTEAQEEAMKRVREVGEFMGQTLIDVFDRLILQGEDWRDVLDDVAKMLIRVLLQAFILGAGPLGSLTGGGIVGNLPTFARGGYLPAGQIGIVGEEGPEIIHGPATITPMEKMPPLQQIAPAAMVRGANDNPGRVEVNVYAPEGSTVEQRQTPLGDGGMRIDVMIDKATAAAVVRPGSETNKALQAVFGVRPGRIARG